MRYIILTLILALNFNISYTQLNSVRIENTNLSWVYAPLDSTYIDFSSSQGMRNGANHFLPILLGKMMIIDGDYLYSLFTNVDEDQSGFILVKQNYKTGSVIWERTFDLRDQPNHIAPSDFRINGDGHLEIISTRRSGPIQYLLWYKGTLARHIYNKDTGELIYYTYGMPDQTAVEFPKVLGLTHLTYNQGNYIFYMQGGGFLDGSGGIGASAYYLDKEGNRTQAYYTEFYPKLFGDEYRWRSSLVYKDTISVLMHYYKEDASDFKTILRTYNQEWNLLRDREIHLPIPTPNEIYLTNVYDDEIEIIAEYFNLHRSFGVSNKLIYLNKNDYRIKEIVEIPFSQNYGQAWTRLKDKSGTLFCKVVLQSVDGQVRGFLQVFKSDGKGNTTLLKDSEVLDLKTFQLVTIKELPDGNFVLAGVYNQIVDSNGSNDFRNPEFLESVLICLNKSELGLMSSAHDITLTSPFILYPNPTSSTLQIVTDADYDHVLIHSTDGKITKQETVSDGAVNVSSLPDGSYVCTLIKGGSIISSGVKFVKVGK